MFKRRDLNMQIGRTEKQNIRAQHKRRRTKINIDYHSNIHTLKQLKKKENNSGEDIMDWRSIL